MPTNDRPGEFDETFKTSIYAYFRLAKAAIPHMKPGTAIIATSTETGLIGNKQLPRLRRHHRAPSTPSPSPSPSRSSTRASSSTPS
jgi:NAD(P)-dependent dehydrogenase (short-subunit alcohol dehydrogenase family)